MKRAFLTFLATAAPLLAALACDSSVDEKIALAKLAQSCLVNSDCSSPLVCAFEACHAECESSRDCDTGARCVAAARPYKVCQLEEERACKRTSDCAEGLVCGVDGECRDQCLTSNDCVEGQQCVSGTCADVDELDESGQLTPAPGKEVGSEGAPCVYVSDCSGALLCRGQACLPQCRADRDCPTSEICADTRCVPDGTQPLACSYNSDCETERGERCLGGGCRCMCAEDRDCSGGLTCDGCGCVAPPDCDYDSDCEEKGQVCRNGGCACACKADADCAEGQECDGCGCVRAGTPVAGIVRGHVNIESSLQLPLYRGVTEIYGDLSISGSAIGDLGNTFDELRFVSGHIIFNGSEALEAIVFPKLETVQGLTISNATKVKTIEFSRLKEGLVSLTTLPSLEGLGLPALKKGSFVAYGLGHLKELSLSVTEVTYFHADESLELEKVELPELTTVRGSFSIVSGSPGKLTTLHAPKLVVFGDEQSTPYFQISGTLLTSLAGVGAEDWQVQAGGLQLLDNGALGTCAVQAFTSRFVPESDPPYTPNIARNLDNCTGACNLVAETCTEG
ncbi:MAG: uncharacterized protein K0R38_4568 [Polyangiaceae bacterium]|jgi:hypothetical protein|nr:uncharacterized protein [Polyangiaceae bacterium]